MTAQLVHHYTREVIDYGESLDLFHYRFISEMTRRNRASAGAYVKSTLWERVAEGRKSPTRNRRRIHQAKIAAMIFHDEQRLYALGVNGRVRLFGKMNRASSGIIRAGVRVDSGR